MKNFLIGGTIIDDESQKWAFEDVAPSQVRSFLSRLEPDEPVEFLISSPGGSVTAGIAIANLIREASRGGHKATAHVVGIAASMASVIACACDEIVIDESAFMMIHNPWTMTQGDADDLRKSADVLDQMKAAILSFYRSKFDKTDDELAALMDDETWFTGAQAADFGFKAEVVKADGELKAAACAREIPSFAKLPEAAAALFVVGKHEPTFDERLAAAMKSRDAEINALKQQLADCQATAIKTVADMEKDFNSKLEVAGKELTDAKAEVTRLAADLENAKKELSETASALDASNKALATLNANVNTPNPSAPKRKVNAREAMAALPPADRAAFYAKHRAEIDANQSIAL